MSDLVMYLIILVIFGYALKLVVDVEKTRRISYKQALLISLPLFIVAYLGIKFLNNDWGSVLTLIVNFFIFHFLLNKFTGFGWLKSLKIFILQGIAFVVLLLIVSFIIKSGASIFTK